MRALPVTLLMAVATCSDSTAPGEDVSVNVTIDKTSFKVRQTVFIELTVVNHSQTTRTVSVQTCPEPFDVLSSSGDIVGPGARMCELILVAPTELAPGHLITVTRPWMGDAFAGPADESVYLAPGHYALRGYVFDGSEKVASPLRDFIITP